MVTSRIKSFLAIVVVAALLPAGADLARGAESLDKFYGSYVGSGTATLINEKSTEQRDLDVTIESFKSNGFTLKWITVVRGPNGKRVSDDIKRREVEENFVPLEGKENVYVLAPKGGLFQKAELPNPLRGEPMRWAKVEDGALTVYSMAISANGGAELQVYRRTLTKNGMNISFLRMQDENVVVKMDGKLVRANK